MTTIRIWTLESDNDAQAVEHLANKLIELFSLPDTSIRTAGHKAVPRRPRDKASDPLITATKHYLEEDDYLIFVIDSDGKMASHQRQQEPNSLINQVNRVLESNRFPDRVHLAWAIEELEAWLLIDCLGVACFFASKKRKADRENCRNNIISNPKFKTLKTLIEKSQPGDTELIVEAEAGGKGAKEYLKDFSKDILRTLNPKMKRNNIQRERYQEADSPDIAKYIEINKETLRRNPSLQKLGELLAQCSKDKR